MQINEKAEIARMSGAAVGVTLWGITLNEWVAIATLIYLLIQIAILAPKAWKAIKFWLGKK